MAFWSAVRGALAGDTVTPNANGPANVRPGEVGGIEITAEQEREFENRALATPLPSSWDGYPSEWQVPDWQLSKRQDQLVDIAWQCLDLNSNIVSSMPCYQTKGDSVVPSTSWMDNPDSEVYTCWNEFAKQVFWDYQMGEAFVLRMGTGYDGYPNRFKVVPPWMMNVEMESGTRTYKLGSLNVTNDILHLRYNSTTVDTRGHGPLEAAGARQLQIKLLQRYVTRLAETGGVPLYWIGVDRRLQAGEAQDLIDQWMDARTKNVGQPGILGSNASLNQARTMDAKEMALLEISQFDESRIAGLLGVPPFLVGLAGASGSLTYSNIADLFDYHHRSSLRPKTKFITQSLSAWALPSGRQVELNSDDYTRLPLDRRVAAYEVLIRNKVLSADDVRIMERFLGTSAAQALTGGNQ